MKLVWLDQFEGKCERWFASNAHQNFFAQMGIF